MRISRDNGIVLGILAVITATYLLVIYRWQMSRLDDMRNQVAERRRRLEADTAKASRVPPMLREIETMEQRYNKDWDRRLPDSQELAGFLKEISGNLSQESLAGPTIAPGDPTCGSLYNVLPITMKFEGRFLQLAGFLKRVDSMTRLTRIEQLTIQPKTDGEDLSIVLGMNIYFTEH